jgi:hypothetical protein
MTPHPLNGSFERVGRAQEHLRDLAERIIHLQGAHTDSFTPQFDSEPPHAFSLTLGVNRIEAPMSIGIRIGEVCYNLRSALDYLIFELARHDSGSEKSGTQFPIDDCPKTFQGRKGGYLKGINAAHIAAIERLQPYKGCNWSKALRDFSNRDKHRQFVNIRGDFVANGFNPFDDVNFDFIQAPIRRAPHPIHGVVDVKVHVRVTIEFADGTPIMETLNEIQNGVTATLFSFKSEF